MPEQVHNPHPCAKCAFYSQSVWEPVGDGAVAALAHRFRRRELSEGQVVWEQGSENTGVTCVSKGLIALRSLHPDGGLTLLRLAYPGEIIGNRSFLTGRAHQTEAKTLLPSRVCVVSRNQATRVVQENPGVLSRLAIRCIDEIDRNHERIIAAASLPNKERLAALLQRLMDAHGEQVEGSYQMRLPLSRSDLADLIGVQPETLSRLMGRLEKDGRFSITGRKVVMPILPAPCKKIAPFPT